MDPLQMIGNPSLLLIIANLWAHDFYTCIFDEKNMTWAKYLHISHWHEPWILSGGLCPQCAQYQDKCTHTNQTLVIGGRMPPNIWQDHLARPSSLARPFGKIIKSYHDQMYSLIRCMKILIGMPESNRVPLNQKNSIII